MNWPNAITAKIRNFVAFGSWEGRIEKRLGGHEGIPFGPAPCQAAPLLYYMYHITRGRKMRYDADHKQQTRERVRAEGRKGHPQRGA